MPIKRKWENALATRKARKTGLASNMRVRRAAALVTQAARLSGRTASKETGYVDIAATGYALDTTGSVTLLNTIAQGSSVNQRVGKKIILKSIQSRGNMTNNGTASANDVAYMIVYDKRPTGALPSITDILVSASANALNNDVNSGRFKIVKRVDEVLTGNTSAAASWQSNMMVGQDWWQSLNNLPVVYKALTTGAIADIEEGALYLVTIGTSAAGTGAATLTTGFRIRFLDV